MQHKSKKKTDEKSRFKSQKQPFQFQTTLFVDGIEADFRFIQICHKISAPAWDRLHIQRQETLLQFFSQFE